MNIINSMTPHVSHGLSRIRGDETIAKGTNPLRERSHGLSRIRGDETAH